MMKKLVLGLLVSVLFVGITQGGEKLVWVMADSADIRSGPSMQAEVVARAKWNDQLLVIEEREEWYKVKLPSGETGWAYGQLCSSEELPPQLRKKIAEYLLESGRLDQERKLGQKREEEEVELRNPLFDSIASYFLAVEDSNWQEAKTVVSKAAGICEQYITLFGEKALDECIKRCVGDASWKGYYAGLAEKNPTERSKAVGKVVGKMVQGFLEEAKKLALERIKG
jgi:uncharacterized protein YgiM (DUF1202 family)